MSLVAVALFKVGQARTQTIIDLRDEMTRLRKEIDERDRQGRGQIADAEKATEVIANDLRPYAQLFATQRPPKCYYPYFSSSDDWNTEFEEKTFQSDKEWARLARELLSQIHALSADNRRTLEEAARLQSPAATDTPLLIRTREVLAGQPSGMHHINIFELQVEDLEQLERFIDFVLGIGVREYRRIAEHTRKVAKRMSPEETADC